MLLQLSASLSLFLIPMRVWERDRKSVKTSKEIVKSLGNVYEGKGENLSGPRRTQKALFSRYRKQLRSVQSGLEPILHMYDHMYICTIASCSASAVKIYIYLLCSKKIIVNT
jgi:hypothetical protein